SQVPPLWPQMSRACGCRRASAARSAGVDSSGCWVPSVLNQVCCRIGAWSFVAWATIASSEGADARRDTQNLAPTIGPCPVHRAVPDAPVQLAQARLDVLAARIAQSEGAVVIMRQRRDHLVILLPQLFGGRVRGKGQAHRDAEPLDAQAVGVPEQ